MFQLYRGGYRSKIEATTYIILLNYSEKLYHDFIF